MKEGNQPFNAQKALRVACLVLADLILINLSAFLALYIRFEFDLKLLCETEFLHNMIDRLFRHQLRVHDPDLLYPEAV